MTAPTPPPLVSVLISTKDNESTLGECLDSLARQTHESFEVVVVSDGSADATLEIAREFARARPNVRVFALEPGRGVAGARNLAMDRAAGEIFAFLDGDAFAEPGWLVNLVLPFREQAGVGCTGGPDVVPADDPLVSRCVGYSMHSLIGSGGLRRGRPRLARYAPAGCNMAVAREVVERVGSFDESILPRGEEKELIERLGKAGVRVVFVPEAVVWHRRRTGLAAFWRQMYASGIGRARILRRHPDRAQPAQLAPAALVAAALLGVLPALAVPAAGAAWLACAGAYGALLAADGLLGAARLRSARAALVVPLTSAIVLLGYGAGTLAGLLRKG